jgi:hypothetical protein
MTIRSGNEIAGVLSSEDYRTIHRLPSVLVRQETFIQSTSGKDRLVIPVGNYYLDAPGESELWINFGSGFVQQTYGVDYQHRRVRGSGAPTTVADAAIGFDYLGGPPPDDSWEFRFVWNERRLLIAPIVVAATRFGQDSSIRYQNNSANPCDGVIVPERQGCVVEFWRRTTKPGGKRGRLEMVPPRDGKRYVPYFRGDPGAFRFHRSTFCTGDFARPRRKFRVCYYDPSTGARSELSNDVIVASAIARFDSVNGRVVRVPGAVWIE